MGSDIKKFIKLAGSNEQSLNTIQHLIRLNKGQNIDIVEYTLENPHIVGENIGHFPVFDFFYGKIIDMSETSADNQFWCDSLVRIIFNLPINVKVDSIKRNHKYMLQLQSNNRGYTNIFRELLEHNFYLGEPSFLVYSLIARGELDKLKILQQKINLKKYEGIYATALRFGRPHIIKYFYEQGYSISDYGMILNFSSYVESFRYLRYSHQIASPSHQKTTIVEYTQHNHVECINLLLQYGYDQDVNVITLDKWCELLRMLQMYYDVINVGQILETIMSLVKTPILLTHDFKEFNYYIFGSEWSDRKYIITYCQQLEQKLFLLTERYEMRKPLRWSNNK